MIVKKSKRVQHANAATCIAYEYGLGDKDIDVAYIKIDGRYPEKGRTLNRKSKEVIFVIDGKGIVEIDGNVFDMEEGDSILIQPNQKFFFDGKLKIVVCCNPAWDPKQYEFVD
ncbi:MAG: cupin domain-containing protein [Candidatus Aenigmarchaeota archaeon]|nr:cupin domain-containing protein [Candidatus Aenigmarchaeota archaeon]